MNIGIHFFDLLMWIFGSCRRAELHLSTQTKMAGMMELEQADVAWFLSIDAEDLPAGYVDKGEPAFRSLTMDGAELEFSSGFTELHTEVYRDVLSGGGFTLADARPAVELVHGLRGLSVEQRAGLVHPALAQTRRGHALPRTSWHPPGS
jgi:UDP-N-acetyl-2-amino-2-deoxyglucuronate dehydrogenase